MVCSHGPLKIVLCQMTLPVSKVLGEASIVDEYVQRFAWRQEFLHKPSDRGHVSKVKLQYRQSASSQPEGEPLQNEEQLENDLFNI